MQKLKRGFGATGLTGLVLGLVVACGGGGGGGVAGIDRLGVTTGTINGFGSIIVNGVEYETNAADFDIDDGPGSQSELKVGQQVTIQWDSSDDGVTRNAQSVSYDDLLEGPIDSIDPGAQTLVILGQVVIVDAATSFDDEIVPRDLTGLELDDVVEVSGLIDANGVIRATRIDFSDSSDDFEVRGVVESLDTDDSTFIINGLTVDYFDVINPPALANGLFVEVEGDTFDAGILYAIRVEIEDDDISGADEGDDGELEGYITDFVSATNFSVSGVPVTTNGQTIYEHGVVGDLALNVKVEVEGELNSSGVLVARQVEFKSGDDDDDGDDDSIDGRVAGNFTAVNAGAGSLAIAGRAVTVTDETRFEYQTVAVGQICGNTLGVLTEAAPAERQIEEDRVCRPAGESRGDRPGGQRDRRQDQHRPSQQTTQATPATAIRGGLATAGQGTETDQRMPAPGLTEQPVEAGAGDRRERQ